MEQKADGKNKLKKEVVNMRFKRYFKKSGFKRKNKRGRRKKRIMSYGASRGGIRF